MARPPVHIPRYLLAAVLLPLAGIPLPTAAAPPAATAWSATIGESGIGAYSVGNPQAKVKLVEYFSYTCSHCAEFAKEAGVPLKAQYIDKGSVLFEYRNLIRDPVDMTAAMLARCGGAKAFAANHQAIFAAQPTWLGKAAKMSKEQQAPWYQGACCSLLIFRSEEHTSELQSLMRNSYAVFCLKKKTYNNQKQYR